MDNIAYLTRTPQGKYCIYSRVQMLDHNYSTIKKCFEKYIKPDCTFYPKNYTLVENILYTNNTIHSRVVGVLNRPLTRENNPEYFI